MSVRPAVTASCRLTALGDELYLSYAVHTPTLLAGLGTARCQRQHIPHAILRSNEQRPRYCNCRPIVAAYVTSRFTDVMTSKT